MSTIILISGVFILIIMILLYVIRKQASFLKNCADIAARALEGDLTVLSSFPERGRLPGRLRGALEDFSGSIIRIKEILDTAGQAGQLLSEASRAGASAEAALKSAGGVAERIPEWEAEITGARGLSDLLRQFSRGTLGTLGSWEEALEVLSAAVRDMSAAVNTVTRIAKEKTEVTRGLENFSVTGEREMETTVRIVRKISDSTAVISEMIDIIDTIAEKTNLLAMNAAIEAAHVGDAGKGFAVVAEEIRRLSETSRESSGEVGTALREIVEEIAVSRTTAERTETLFLSLAPHIRSISGGMEELLGAAEELTAGTKRILEVLSTVSRSNSERKEASDHLEGAVRDSEDRMDRLFFFSRETKESIGNLSRELGALSRCLEDLSRTAGDNQTVLRALEEIMETFSVGESDSVILRDLSTSQS